MSVTFAKRYRFTAKAFQEMCETYHLMGKGASVTDLTDKYKLRLLYPKLEDEMVEYITDHSNWDEEEWDREEFESHVRYAMKECKVPLWEQIGHPEVF